MRPRTAHASIASKLSLAVQLGDLLGKVGLLILMVWESVKQIIVPKSHLPATLDGLASANGMGNTALVFFAGVRPLPSYERACIPRQAYMYMLYVQASCCQSIGSLVRSLHAALLF